MICNQLGLKVDNILFQVDGSPLEVVDEYQYLGIKFKPSGTFQVAPGELLDKANRAWFSISNVLYQHKKMAVRKALLLFDSLIRPMVLYAVAFWLPFIMAKKSFESMENLFEFW